MPEEEYVDSVTVESVHWVKLSERIFQANSVEDERNCNIDNSEHCRSSLCKKELILVDRVRLYDWRHAKPVAYRNQHITSNGLLYSGNVKTRKDGLGRCGKGGNRY
jgi:hypothetical protein